MVVHKHGDHPSSTLSRYVGPTEIVHRKDKVFLMDAGADTVIAELTAAAAEAHRTGQARTVTTFTGETVTLNQEGR